MYLDEPTRQTAITQNQQIEVQSCSDDDADIRERIRIYLEKRDQDICWNMEARLASLQRLNSGIPTSEMRELEEVINTSCN